MLNVTHMQLQAVASGLMAAKFRKLLAGALPQAAAGDGTAGDPVLPMLDLAQEYRVQGERAQARFVCLALLLGEAYMRREDVSRYFLQEGRESSDEVVDKLLTRMSRQDQPASANAPQVSAEDAARAIQATEALPPRPFSPIQPRVPAGFDAHTAVRHLRTSALDAPRGHCVRHVRQALEAGGVRLAPAARPLAAMDYGPCLEQCGFAAVPMEDGYRPRAGDVAVLEGFDAARDRNGKDTRRAARYGHIQMWDGEQWISDFRQGKDIHPGPAYRAAAPAYRIYRFAGG